MKKERSKDFGGLLRDKNALGECRDLIKSMGDLETIYLCLKEDKE